MHLHTRQQTGLHTSCIHNKNRIYINLYKNNLIRWLNLQSCHAMMTKYKIFFNEKHFNAHHYDFQLPQTNDGKVKDFMMSTKCINLIQLQKYNFNSLT